MNHKVGIYDIEICCVPQGISKPCIPWFNITYLNKDPGGPAEGSLYYRWSRHPESRCYSTNYSMSEFVFCYCFWCLGWHRRSRTDNKSFGNFWNNHFYSVERKEKQIENKKMERNENQIADDQLFLSQRCGFVVLIDCCAVPRFKST